MGISWGFHRDFMGNRWPNYVFNGIFIGSSWENRPVFRRTSAGVPAQLGKPTTVGNQPSEEGPGPGRIGGWETVKPIFLLPILIRQYIVITVIYHNWGIYITIIITIRIIMLNCIGILLYILLIFHCIVDITMTIVCIYHNSYINNTYLGDI